MCRTGLLWRDAREVVESSLRAANIPVPAATAHVTALDSLSKMSNSNGHMDLREYEPVVAEVVRRAPCNFLVFSCGDDSVSWTLANPGGKV